MSTKLSLLLSLITFSIGSISGQEIEMPAKNRHIDNELSFDPYLIDCENAENKTECTNQKLIDFISKNIKYPSISRENGNEGTLILGYIINKGGYLVNDTVYHGFDSIIRLEGGYLLNKMKSELRWIPGKLNGDKVSVLYKLPLHFSVLNKPVRKLKNIEEILCERGETYYLFEVKNKKIKKCFSSKKRFEDFWYYEIWEKEFLGMDIEIEYEGEVENIFNLLEMNENVVNTLTQCDEGTILTFRIKEKSNEEIVEVLKKVRVK